MGENPSGHLSSTFDGSNGAPPVQERFDVTCVAVVGNQAAIGLVPTGAASNDATTQRVLSVLDSGMPGGTGDMSAFFIPAPAQNCPLYVGSHVFTPLSGNIVVRDSVPDPMP